MHWEIERRFLATSSVLDLCHDGCLMVQGYLRSDSLMTVRVRIAGDQAFLTIKGRRTGTIRLEHESSIPLLMARQLLFGVPVERRIEKTRYHITIEDALWELDVFHGLNDGLIIAEIEDPPALLHLPDWIEREITDDRRYSNSTLARTPYQTWALRA